MQHDHLPLNPGHTLGMMGGGQLGRMFAIEAAYMGYHVTVLEPGAGSPAAEVSLKHIAQPYLSEAGLDELAQTTSAVSTEFENVPAQALNRLAQDVFVAPPGSAVAVAQDRNAEKEFIESVAKVPVAPHFAVLTASDIEKAPEELFPAILKTARLGYDGKGQVLVNSREDLHKAFVELKEVDCILEKRLNLHREVSVIVARGADGQTATFPVCENLHRRGILAVTVMPARVPEETALKAREYATAIVDALHYVGVLCVEFFVLQNGEIVANEMAPRPHNSGHATIDACWSNQFEQQLRCMTGQPLADTTQHSPAVMLNLLGDLWFDEDDNPKEPDWQKVLAVPGAKLHLYGKAQARHARKMGHITCVGKTLEEALQRAQMVARILGLPEPK